MKTFEITRTRLVTEVFRVDAETQDEAFDILGNGDEPGDFEKVSESTLQSDSTVQEI